MLHVFKISLIVAVLTAACGTYAETPEECADLLAFAETGQELQVNVYDYCGFDDEKTAWEQWAPFVSEHNYKRAIFELCDRYPNHVYHQIYCDKAAQLGYGPALALKAQAMIKSGDSAGLQWASDAVSTKELSSEQTGRLLETIGVFHLKNNNSKYREYLEQAAERRSALANHILGAQLFIQPNASEETLKAAFMHIWRAVLLDCPSAQENLGLFHLVRQQKVPHKMAVQMMTDNMLSCESKPVSVKEQQDNLEMYNCQCKTVLANEKRYRDKPFLLLSVQDDTAILKDSFGLTYQVKSGDNLPNMGTVAEVRKTAVIITYPNDRVILNKYEPDKCVDFCNEHKITENLTVGEMQKRIVGAKHVVIKPYKLTFTPAECDSIQYYAQHLVDTQLPYVGKTECHKETTVAEVDDILLQVKQAESAGETVPVAKPDTSSDKSDKPYISDETKQRLKSFGSDILGIE